MRQFTQRLVDLVFYILESLINVGTCYKFNINRGKTFRTDRLDFF